MPGGMVVNFGPMIPAPKPPWSDRLRAFLCRVIGHSVKGESFDGLNRVKLHIGGNVVVCKRCGFALGRWP